MSIVSALTIPPAQTLNAVGSGAADRQIVAAGAGAVPSVVYGEAIVTGRILNVLAAAGGSSLVVQVVWALGPIQSIDLPLYKDRALPAGATVTHYLGTAGQAVDATMVAAMSAQSITYTATLAGVAYSVFVVPITGFDGSLKFTARVRGRLLYDPRKDSNVPGGTGAHRLATPGTWEYSDNPALADADWLRSDVYGCGVAVDWVSVMAAANACDAMIGSPAEKRRIISLELDASRPVVDVAEVLRAYAGVWHVHVQASASAGAVKLVPDADAAAVASYSHASGQILRFGPLQARDIASAPTAVEVVYTDASKRPTRDAFARASVPGAGSTLPLRLSQVRLPGVTRYSQAMREATERLNKLRLGDLTAGIEMLDEGIRHEVGDIINITHPVGVTAKPFRIAEPPQLVATGRWRAALVEHDPAVYSSTVQTVPSVPDTALVIGGSRPADWAALLNRPADAELLNSLAPKPRGVMNADPACETPGAWELIGTPEFGTTSAAGAVGATCLLFGAASALNSMAYSREAIPVSHQERYNLSARLWVAAGNARNMYVVVRMFRANGSEYTGFAPADANNTGWGGAYAGYVYGGLPTPGAFAEYGADFGAGTSNPIPSDVAYVRVGVWGQYNPGSGQVVQLAQHVRLANVTAVRAAKSVADTAAANATSALSTLQTMRSNGFLDASEKPALIREWQGIVAENAGIYSQGTAYGLTSLRNAYEAAFLALSNYLGNLSPGWSDTTVDTPITPAVDQARWSDYYAAREALLRAVEVEAGTRAVWGSVTGAGRPSDNATRDLGLSITGPMSLSGNSAQKTGALGWDSSVTSQESFAGGAYVSFVPRSNGLLFMMGLNTDPASDANYTSIDYAIYCENGVLYCSESGSIIGPLTSFNAGDALAVLYDGSAVRYVRNGSVFRSVAANITAPLFLDSSFFTTNAAADRIVFGPMSAVRDIATNQLAPGAATESFFATPADGSITGAAAGNSQYVIATSSWTNQTAAAVVVEVSLAFSYRAINQQNSGVSGQKSFFGLQVSGGVTSTFQKVVPRADEMQGASIIANVSVPAGQTITMDVFAQPTNPAGWVMQVFWSEVQFRWAAIKR